MRYFLFLLTAVLLISGCEMGRTSVGTGGGPVQTSDTAIEERPQTAPAGVGYSYFPSPGGFSGGACPILSPITGEVICSCSSLQAGEC